MKSRACYQVIVRTPNGRVIKNWKASWFGELIVKTENRTLIIEKKNFFGMTQVFIPGRNESVEIRGWWWRVSRFFSDSW